MTYKEKARVAMIAKTHRTNAINRLTLQSSARFDDPFKRLAAAVILQAAIDKLRGESERSYWYYGRKVTLVNDMTKEDYQFYADIAGIQYSWREVLQSVKRKNPKIGGKVARDAVEFFVG